MHEAVAVLLVGVEDALHDDLLSRGTYGDRPLSGELTGTDPFRDAGTGHTYQGKARETAREIAELVGRWNEE